jgi:hypothetical protein
MGVTIYDFVAPFSRFHNPETYKSELRSHVPSYFQTQKKLDINPIRFSNEELGLYL